MIVKNESKAIERCLKSVYDIVDYWVIVDTGSTDGTQKLIKKCMAGKPGELHERPWVDFSTNRNEALTLAKGKGDYLLLIDADEELVFSSPFNKTSLTLDRYGCIIKEPSTSYVRDTFLRNNMEWKYVGVLHELLTLDQDHSYDIIKGITNISRTTDGARSQDPNKYKKDALTLENALLSEPDNARYVFYLGQCYFNAKEYDLALKNYEKRLSMTGDFEEGWFASYMVAALREFFNSPYENVVQGYLFSYQVSPKRLEPLIALAKYYYNHKQYVLSYTLLKDCLFQPKPAGIHVMDGMYDSERWFVYASSAEQLGKWQEAAATYQHLLTQGNVPENLRVIAENNLAQLMRK